jgi:subtilase family serine protease
VTAGVTALAAPASAAGAPALVPAGCAQASAGHAHCNAIQLVTGSAAPAAPSGYGPGDIQSAYHLGTNPGSGQTVAIVDAYDDPNAESDLRTYRSQYGLAACTTANGCFQKVDQNGGTNYPGGDTGWGTEITLDLDAVSATCPGCRILLVEATSNNDTDLAAAVDEAVRLGAKFVSNSYSDAESDFSTGLDGHYNHAGVVIAAATGDNGSLSGSSAQFPATFPTVVAVGGTSLSKASNSRGWTESAWSKGGSGCSSLFAKPSYQNVSTSCGKRATSDVSAVGDPNTGLAIYDTYGQSGWA